MNFIGTLLVSNLLNVSPTDTRQYQLVLEFYTKKGNPGIEIYSVNAVSKKPSLLYTKKNANTSYLTITNEWTMMYAISKGLKDESKVNSFKSNSNNEFETINSSADKPGGGQIYGNLGKEVTVGRLLLQD
jgi:6-phosphogluconolactonase (cycloisomerase 2 family)